MAEETVLGTDDAAGADALGRRIRSSIDGDAAPLTIDEVRRRSEGPTAGDGDDAAGGPPGQGGQIDAADERPGSSRRVRPLVWLAAAAAVVLIVGVGAFAVSRPDDDGADDLDVISGPGTTTLATTPPTSTVVVEPAPGGLYDPASTVLADRTVLAMARDEVGRLYVSYVERVGTGTDPVPVGVLVADARDGSVTADHPLPRAAPAIATSGSTLWSIVGDPSTGIALWRFVDGAAPEAVGSLPESDLPAELAASEEGVWVRLLGRLQHRDPATGELIEESTDPKYGSVGAIAVDGHKGWTAGLGQLSGPPSGTLVRFEDVEPDAIVGSEPVGPLAMVDGNLIAAIGATHLVVTGPDGSSTTVAEADHGIQGIDGRDGRVWAVANDVASSSEIGVVTFALGGEPRWLELGLDGMLPSVVAIDEHHALVCAVATAQPPATEGGSTCRLLDARTAPDEVATTTPETAPTTVALPSSTTTTPVTTTTTAPPSFPEVEVTSTTRAPRPLNPAGLSGNGLDPIEFMMDQDQFLAATTEPFRRADPQCGHEVYLDSSGGVEVHLYPVVEGDGSSGRRWSVGAVAVKTSAFSTATGARVGMTTAQLEASTPALEHGSFVATVGGPKDPGQYVLRTGRGAIRFNHADGVVNQIVVTSVSNDFFTDLC